MAHGNLVVGLRAFHSLPSRFHIKIQIFSLVPEFSNLGISIGVPKELALMDFLLQFLRE
jgi:hypothetical protein